jgi:hypothetical protein
MVLDQVESIVVIPNAIHLTIDLTWGLYDKLLSPEPLQAVLGPRQRQSNQQDTSIPPKFVGGTRKSLAQWLVCHDSGKTDTCSAQMRHSDQ